MDGGVESPLCAWQPPQPKEAEGLSDGGKEKISCSGCSQGLMEVWKTRSDKTTWKVQATCPFCGDRSFVKVIHGSFHFKGAGVPDPNDEDNEIATTIVVDSDLVDDKYLFEIQKAK